MTHQDFPTTEKHLAFGKNWSSYAALIGEREITQAKAGLLKLVPEAEMCGRTFIDIGCGSGLHALAAAQLGVSRIVAIDYDSDSANTAKALLEAFGVAVPWSAARADLFDLDPAQIGRFDIVYSWGVLHHTGNMWRAIEKTTSFVAPGGLLVLALYRSTEMDAFWRREKRWYSQASPGLQYVARALYLCGHWLSCTSRGESYRNMVRTYHSSRGMDFYHDIHDCDPPSKKWSDLKYVHWHQGGPICRGRGTSLRRSSRSCDRSTSWSRKAMALSMQSARLA